MQFNFPNIDEMTIVEAIHWYTKEVAEVSKIENLVNGKYSDEYKVALLRWKKELNKKALAERNQF